MPSASADWFQFRPASPGNRLLTVGFPTMSTKGWKRGRAVDVLLVEDNELLRETLEDELGEAGLNVLGLACAEAALSAVNDNTAPPTVIVTDVQLGPGMNGLMLAAELRRRWPEANILVMTGEVENLAGLSDGERSSCFIKPFEPARLTAAVKKLMGAAGSGGSPRASCGSARPAPAASVPLSRQRRPSG
ncbi:response regulator [Falsiroseomonas sp. HC035]|uniref:response regulator n=1 Tax=Falsiroseomonas sp. HC035 TaxID=3390999 RepID=UPI003D315656